MNLQIRPASVDEERHLHRIHQELKRPARDTYPPEEFLIAWLEDEAVGCAGTAVHQDGAYFYGLAVRKAWQRQGVGSQLMQARIDLLAGTKMNYAIALVMFWNSRFFRKFDFAPVKRNALPQSAGFHADLTNPLLRRSAVMVRSFRQAIDPTVASGLPGEQG